MHRGQVLDCCFHFFESAKMGNMFAPLQGHECEHLHQQVLSNDFCVDGAKCLLRATVEMAGH